MRTISLSHRCFKLSLFGVVALFCLGCNSSRTGSSTLQLDRMVPMRGVAWTAGDSISQESIDGISELGVNWISQTPFGWQRGYNKPNIGQSFHTGGMWGERDFGLIHTAKLAKAQGIKTMLKPHLWLTGNEGKWRSDLAMETEEDWLEWFKNYGEFMLHYAKLAQEAGMESLCIGTELHKTVVERPDDWRALIAKIRQVYTGQLTYAANFYKEYENLTFWDALDFIGIQGYFPIGESENPSLEELIIGWKKHIKAIEKVSKKFNKKVVFTEIGYKSTKDAAISPWEWPDHQNASFSDTSMVTQERSYEAMFQTFSNQEWIDGVFIWKWHPKSIQSPERKHLTDSLTAVGAIKPYPPIGFTPQKKPAEQVMKKWFQKWGSSSSN